MSFNTKGKNKVNRRNITAPLGVNYNSATSVVKNTTVKTAVKEVLYCDYVTNDEQITLSNLPTIDGVQLEENDVLLLTGQPALDQNRLYQVKNGAWNVVSNDMSEVYRVVIKKGNGVGREYFITNKEDVINDSLGAILWAYNDLTSVPTRLVVTLNKTQLEDLHNTPIELLPQRLQGANDSGSYRVLNCSLQLDYNSTPYNAFSGTFRLRYDAIPQADFMQVQDDFIAQTQDSFTYMNDIAVGTLAVGSGISIFKNGQIIDGDSTMIITIDYIIVL